MEISAVQFLRMFLVVCSVGSVAIRVKGQGIADTHHAARGQALMTAPALWAELGKVRQGNKVFMCVCAAHSASET